MDCLENLKRLLPNGVGVLVITPELAQQLLDTTANPANREIRTGHMLALANDMKAGRWRLTHQGLAWGRSGIMLDGHHRLRSVIHAGVPVKFWVFLDLDDAAFDAIDYHGATRSIRDIMSIRHHQATGSGKLSPKTIEPLSYLAVMMNANKLKVTLWQVEQLYRLFRCEIDELNGAIGDTRAKGRTAASTKAAVMLRLFGAAPGHREYLLDQWRAFVLLNYDEMDATTQSLLRRMDNIGVNRTGAAVNERAGISWVGFGPDRTMGKVTIRNINTLLSEMRVVVNEVVVRDNRSTDQTDKVVNLNAAAG